MKGIRSFLSVLLLATLGWSTQARIPPQHLPWTQLDVKSSIGLFTKNKIVALQNNMGACHAVLMQGDIDFEPLASSAGTADCPLVNMVNLEKTLYAYNTPVRANCALAAAVAIWEAQVVATAAKKHLSSPIARIHHAGIFACRNVRGSANRRSQHATATAIDITGFTLQNGTRISILNDWGKNTPAGRFLSEIHSGGCRVFRGALGPGYNSLHSDHFHFDIGDVSVCR